VLSGKSYQDLELWQKAMDLTVECYSATRSFPSAGIYGLCSQLQRAAVSIPANIAEGQRRQHKPEFVQHLCIANGSLAEVETHIQLAERRVTSKPRRLLASWNLRVKLGGFSMVC
jgi:four helix bundle protein